MATYLPRLRRYQEWLAANRHLRFPDYESLWRWSVTDQAAFWQSLWDFEGMTSPTPHTAVLTSAPMPATRWFPGAQANFARRLWQQVEPAHAAGVPAIVAEDETGRVREIGWREFRRQIASMALNLRALGVQRGDRVVAVLPNGPEAAVAFYAAASLGAVWSQCAPDMGARAVLDRFRQITPRVLVAADGVHHAGRPIDRTGAIAALRAELPSVEALVRLRTPWGAGPLAAEADFDTAISRDDAEVAAFEPEWLPFDHPLWIVYSSGTTGAPKALVHGHGGIQLILAASNLHNDIGASHDPNSLGERFHWFSSTGWIMWNLQVGALSGGTTICLFDGSPGGPRDAPDWSTLWRFAARHGVTWFGSGAAFYANVVKAGVDLAACGDLSRIRALGSTGSPLAEDVQRAVSAQFARLGTPDIWWHNISGGTDFCGAFLTGSRLHPSVPGRMECRQLGAAVEAWNDAGEPVIDEVGELVCTRPLPSMPLYLWNDPDGERYRSSYFDLFPGVWRHGDWLRLLPDGSGIIYGRSDATINRHGLRLGTSEIYAAVEALPEVLDSLVIDLEVLGQPSWMGLFVVLRAGGSLDASLRERIAQAIRTGVSARFVPDAIVEAPAVPRTLSGKKQEVPIKRLFLGHPIDQVLNRDAMANPECLAWYQGQAAAHRSSRAEPPSAGSTGT